MFSERDCILVNTDPNSDDTTKWQSRMGIRREEKKKREEKDD